MLADWLTRVLFKKRWDNWPGILAVFRHPSPIILPDRPRGKLALERQQYAESLRPALSNVEGSNVEG